MVARALCRGPCTRDRQDLSTGPCRHARLLPACPKGIRCRSSSPDIRTKINKSLKLTKAKAYLDVIVRNPASLLRHCTQLRRACTASKIGVARVDGSPRVGVLEELLHRALAYVAVFASRTVGALARAIDFEHLLYLALPDDNKVHVLSDDCLASLCSVPINLCSPPVGADGVVMVAF